MSFQCQNIVKKPTRGPKGRMLPKSQWTETGPCYEGMKDGARPTRVVTEVRVVKNNFYYVDGEGKIQVKTYMGEETARSMQVCQECSQNGVSHRPRKVVEVKHLNVYEDGLTNEEIRWVGIGNQIV